MCVKEGEGWVGYFGSDGRFGGEVEYFVIKICRNDWWYFRIGKINIYFYNLKISKFCFKF